MTNIKRYQARVATLISLLIIGFGSLILSYHITSLGQYEEINLGIVINFESKENLKLSQVAVKFEEERTIIELNISYSNKDFTKDDAICISFDRKNSSMFTFNDLRGVSISDSGEPFKPIKFENEYTTKESKGRCYIMKNVPQKIDIRDYTNFFLRFEFNSIFSEKKSILKNNKIINLLIDGQPMVSYFIGIPIDTTLVTNYPSSKPASLLRYTLAEKEGKMKFYIFDKSNYNPLGTIFTANIVINVFDTRLFVALTGLFLALLFRFENQISIFIQRLYQTILRLVQSDNDQQLSSEHEEALYADSGE